MKKLKKEKKLVKNQIFYTMKNLKHSFTIANVINKNV